MNRHLFMLLGVFVVLGGCSLTPVYTRPEAPVPTAWPTGPAYDASRAATDAAPVAEIAWREFFTDERMQRVIATAIENNRDLRLAALNVQRARGIYGIQRAALFPALRRLGPLNRIDSDEG